MKLAFSNSGCSELGLDELIAQSKAWGYAGFELKYFEGRFDLTTAPTLKHNADQARAKLADAGQTLVALNTSLSFCGRDRRKVAENQRKVREYIELAGRVSAKFVVVAGDVLEPGMSRARAIAQTAEILTALATEAAQHDVRLAIENIGDFAGSREMWLVHDAVRFPTVRVCWNQANARMLNERPSLSIPRLGHAMGIVRLTDARFTDEGLIESYAELGKGEVNAERILELLKGVAFDGWLCVDWPRLWQPNLAPAEKVLPAAAQFVTEILERKPVVLTAYKGDKNAPRFVSRAPQDAAS